MNVFLGIIGRIVLDDPIDTGYIQSPRRHVGAQQYPGLVFTKLKKGRGSFHLFLSTVNVHAGYINVIQ